MENSTDFFSKAIPNFRYISSNSNGNSLLCYGFYIGENNLGIDRTSGEWILNEITGSDWQEAYVPQGQSIPRWQM